MKIIDPKEHINIEGLRTKEALMDPVTVIAQIPQIPKSCTLIIFIYIFR